MKYFILFFLCYFAFSELTIKKSVYHEITDDTFFNETKNAAVLIFYKPYNAILCIYLIDGVLNIKEY